MRTIDLFSVQTKLEKKDLIQAIKNSKGRTLLTELFTTKPALLGDVSNMETARAFGADLLLLNDIDLTNMKFPGFNKTFHTINELKAHVGCPIGIDLYIIHPENSSWPGPQQAATISNLEKAIEVGFDFVNIVADPNHGVTNEQLVNHLEKIQEHIKKQLVIISGRMNFAGLSGHANEIFTLDFIKNLARTGVDILLFPVPGTAQGVDMTFACELIKTANANGMMTMSGIGSSQEGADEHTIRHLAMNARMIGVDIHHLGDAGYVSGMPTPENIMTYSVAIKGKRHTYRKMARR